MKLFQDLRIHELRGRIRWPAPFLNNVVIRWSVLQEPVVNLVMTGGKFVSSVLSPIPAAEIRFAYPQHRSSRMPSTEIVKQCCESITASFLPYMSNHTYLLRSDQVECETTGIYLKKSNVLRTIPPVSYVIRYMLPPNSCMELLRGLKCNWSRWKMDVFFWWSNGLTQQVAWRNRSC